MFHHNLQPPDPAAGLRTENDFLKLKLMLEQGAHFHAPPGAPPPDPLLENMFLKEVITFEEKQREAGTIRVGEKLGLPADFLPADEIPEGLLDGEIARLRERMHVKGIHLATLSPNIEPRELYRFMTGDFLELPMRNLDSPGIYCFVYDDFHPDPYYENEWTALECCIKPVLKLGPIHAFLPGGGGISLNGHERLDEEECRERISRFHECFSDIVPLRCEALKTVIRGRACQVTGRYVLGLCAESECRIARGQWTVELVQEDDGEWKVSAVTVEGIPL